MATWSGIRKKLETEYLAQSLQGHIQYYEDIDEQTLNEIVNNKKLKWIQISDYLPNEAYRKIDQILSERPDITFRLFHFLNNDEVDISFLMDMPHVKKVQIDCIEFKNNPKRINLSVLAELNLKSLHIECFDLRDYEFIQNLSDELEELSIINKLSDISFIEELTNLEIIKLQDLKHVNCLPDLRKHANLQRLFIIDTGIDIKELPNYLQEKVSNWDDR